jgi:glycosyltransferase involved in cell wall biosynthesis
LNKKNFRRKQAEKKHKKQKAEIPKNGKTHPLPVIEVSNFQLAPSVSERQHPPCSRPARQVRRYPPNMGSLRKRDAFLPPVPGGDGAARPSLPWDTRPDYWFELPAASAQNFNLFNAMKRALIATLFNEADNVVRWWDCLMRQTVKPDEIVIVDGGSTDGTWEKLQELARQSPVQVKLEQRRCNIAAGRNRAIGLTDAEIIAATDAGSFPEPEWFHEITRPLLEDASVDCTGGINISDRENDFANYLALFEPRSDVEADQISGNKEVHPSSRNTAFRRPAWADVGGYPEWLTLAAEDALFTHELHRVGKKIIRNPRAVVHWSVRDSADAFLKLLYRNAYGSAEARLDAPYFFRKALITFFPLLLLLSRHRFRHLKFRWGKNAASTRGWLAGFFRGHRAPAGWKRVDKIYLSPEAQATLARNKK